MDWPSRAHELADRVTHPGSRWRDAVVGTPRHQFVPAWWQRAGGHWKRRYGPADEKNWLDAAYQNRTLVTKIGSLHADQAKTHDEPTGRPTSSATLPGLVLQMYRHARIGDKQAILDVGTGSGYGAALLCHLFGDGQVTSIDVDDYVTSLAVARLAELDHSPRIMPMDALGDIPWRFDRIVAMVSVRPIPASKTAHGRGPSRSAGRSWPCTRVGRAVCGTCLTRPATTGSNMATCRCTAHTSGSPQTEPSTFGAVSGRPPSADSGRARMMSSERAARSGSALMSPAKESRRRRPPSSPERGSVQSSTEEERQSRWFSQSRSGGFLVLKPHDRQPPCHLPIMVMPRETSSSSRVRTCLLVAQGWRRTRVCRTVSARRPELWPIVI